MSEGTQLSSIFDLLESVVNRARTEHGMEPVRYDLGCGLHPAPGFRGVDKYAIMGGDQPNIAADLFTDGGWGFTPDNSVGVFFASHFVEHVADWNHFFTQAYRKLKPGGYFVITTPYYLSVRATQDPDHKQMISRERYYYLSADWLRINDLSHYQAAVDFEVCAFYPIWNEEFAHLVNSEQTNAAMVEYHLRHTPNAVDDLTVVLRARKEIA